MNPMVKVEHLTQYIHNRLVLDDINLTVDAASLLVLYGAVGVGKTTLVSILAGIQKHASGSVKTPPQSKIGLVTQRPSLFPNFTVAENLQAVGMLRGLRSKYLNQRMTAMVDMLALEQIPQQKIEHLPYGVRQKTALACALLDQPQLLLVDGLLARSDADSSRLMFDCINQYVRQGGTCIWTTNLLPEAKRLAHDGATHLGHLENSRLTVYHQPGEWLKDRQQDQQPGGQHDMGW